MLTIIMMHGLPGTGKSFIADKIATHFPNAIVLKTVKYRENLENASPERFDETNPKTREEKDLTYKKLCESAKKALEEGKMPILDATFHKRYRREWVYNLAKEMNAKLIVISTYCDENIAFERLKRREIQMTEDSFLKSQTAYKIMKSQADSLDEKGLTVTYVDSANLNINQLVRWLENNLAKTTI